MREHVVINDLIHSNDKKLLSDFLGHVQPEKVEESFADVAKKNQDVLDVFDHVKANQAQLKYRDARKAWIKVLNHHAKADEFFDWDLSDENMDKQLQCVINESEKHIVQLNNEKDELQKSYQIENKKLNELSDMLEQSETLMHDEQVRQQQKHSTRILRKSYINQARWLLVSVTISFVGYKVFLLLQGASL